ncbi:TRAP transporter small permease [Chelatococcus sp. SYSU_G07232]|uniref:TRAP transporter small permease protein n=1 Tax=Chelatococcus albus TaxID=3047466 RepID=A0ABT7AKH8_9HYPH|nr:TRAP transporter small permease [Chelatococcus sp. SYSU_G07232]MDJ1159116.1 TRAP transporter small permease [Chelatococcus sp. SYSU_G07232]
MSHGFELAEAAGGVEPVATGHPLVAALARSLAVLNRLVVLSSSVALVVASVILSYSVLVRYLFKAPTYWQDEASVFLLVGATFLSSAHVQERRGHVGIEALTGFLSPRANRLRLLAVDLASFIFCAFFAWKSWTLWHEAWVDGQVSSSTWAPPLWIPYSVMAAGMTLLSLQILLQILAFLSAERRP